MLGVNYQHIYCQVTKCNHNQTNHTWDMDGKIIATRYTCEKEAINIDTKGQCLNKSIRKRKKNADSGRVRK